MQLLVTGGAGYIGSHVVRQLGEAGHRIVVLDNLSTGHAWALLYGELVEGDINDLEGLQRLFAGNRFDAVLHFAGSVDVNESVSHPLKYYGNNTCGTRNLLHCCIKHEVRQFIFSSTAAVYGIPNGGRAGEDTPTAPINPYGASKLIIEWILRDLSATTTFRYVALRYFNVAGADLEGRIGQATPNATHLIKVACEAAVGKRDSVTLFGNDYPTSDGTCIRDYIHVDDLARAHVLALDYLRRGNRSVVLNCGYGHGYSVTEVLQAVRRVSGIEFPVILAGRRAGDSPELIADNQRVKAVLGWEPQHDALELIVRTALEWERALRRRTSSWVQAE